MLAFLYVKENSKEIYEEIYFPSFLKKCWCQHFLWDSRPIISKNMLGYPNFSLRIPAAFTTIQTLSHSRQGSYSFELFKFHDFPWPLQVFQDLRLSGQFQKFKTFSCFGAFFDLEVIPFLKLCQLSMYIIGNWIV